MLKRLSSFAVVTLCGTLLVACGGGGGDGGNTTPAATTFPLQQAFASRIAAGSTDNFTVSGSCTGTATISGGATPATTVTFEGQAAFPSAQSAELNLTDCTPARIVDTGTSYYDSKFMLLGTSSTNEYTKFQALPIPFPTSVTADSREVLYLTLSTYDSSTNTTPNGERKESYQVVPDTADTATVRLISKVYDAATPPVLQYTQTGYYRLRTDGQLSLRNIKVQYSPTFFLDYTNTGP
jgi:hypothetical protein